MGQPRKRMAGGGRGQRALHRLRHADSLCRPHPRAYRRGVALRKRYVSFIHNPYDAYSYVISIERRYSSDLLKEQTDKLVYIPYFVLAEPVFEGKSEEEIEKMEEGIEHFVIYDDSADLDRAIVVSDAYYGDASSIVQLFQKTRKPIMIQNIEFAA